MPELERLHGDCRAVLATLPADSIDACVTDPPYELAFMGRQWDATGIAFQAETWREVLRVMRPGAHLVAFGGTRTQHRMVCAIEDAGFEIRDCLMWLYSCGFPKSRASLKPAYEPIILARKPLIGTGAQNVLAHGCGGLNIDASRVPGADAQEGRTRHGGGVVGAGTNYELPDSHGQMPAGRWPANLLHDGSDEVEAAFAAFGERTSGARNGVKSARVSFGDEGTFAERARDTGYSSEATTGSASRFFYSAKAGKADRAGSKHPTVKPLALMRWLCRLVTPPGGRILDPFAGSGTTGEAAMLEGFSALLIEQAAEHSGDIEHRIGRWHGADLPLFAEAAD